MVCLITITCGIALLKQRFSQFCLKSNCKRAGTQCLKRILIQKNKTWQLLRILLKKKKIPPLLTRLYHCHTYHNYCMSTSWELRKSVFRTVPQAVMGPLFRHNECVRDQTSCKVNVGKNEVHLTSIYSPQLLKIAFALVLPLDIFLPITKSHKDPPSVLCVCALSALML